MQLYSVSIDKIVCVDIYCLLCSQLVVSAGMFRIYGAEVAELPLVATSADYQGQVIFTSLCGRIATFFLLESMKFI